jgi:EAL domain-containing protein (putative c-di-GMP-specific phosphodiesterase class I)
MPAPLETLVAVETLVSYFKPIVSIKRKRCVAVQALSRIKQTREANPLSPKNLFELAGKEGLSVELDRLCRQKALQGFAKLKVYDPDLLLFLKFDGAVLNEGVLGSGVLLEAVRELGLSTGHIVIEINNSQVKNLELLLDFVKLYRSHGFLIAIDDLNQGSPNLNRMALLRPDIIILGRTMMDGMDKDFVRGEIFKAMAGLARRIGALVMADGLETETDVCMAMDLGIELLSGFYFSKPLEARDWDAAALQKAVDSCAGLDRGLFISRTQQSSGREKKRLDLMSKIARQLAQKGPDDMDYVLIGNLKEGTGIECLYVLDRFGWQVTHTVTDGSLSGRTRNSLFKPAPRGTNHSSKEYFHGTVDANRSHTITEPYISMASGNLCRTFSAMVKDRNGVDYVLCMDVIHEA